MTRIVGGAAGGRRLTVPSGRGTRPTSERAREALFSALLASEGGLDGLRVLDLYAGSGAVGLEALSRGARHACLVESESTAARALRSNVAALHLHGAEVVPAKVERVLAAPAPAPYDVVFADPPYATTDDELAGVLAAAVVNGWLQPGGVLVVERSSRSGEPPWPAGVDLEKARRYGEATLWYGRARPEPPEQAVTAGRVLDGDERTGSG